MTTTSDIYDSIEMGVAPEQVKKRQEERRRRTREAEKLKEKQERKAKCKERLWQFFIAVSAAIVAGLLLWLLEK